MHPVLSTTPLDDCRSPRESPESILVFKSSVTQFKIENTENEFAFSIISESPAHNVVYGTAAKLADLLKSSLWNYYFQ